MKTKWKNILVLATVVTIAVMTGCSSTDKRAEEPVPVATTEMSTTTPDPYYNAYEPYSEPYHSDDTVTTTYSSADLGSTSSGMGR